MKPHTNTGETVRLAWLKQENCFVVSSGHNVPIPPFEKKALDNKTGKKPILLVAVQTYIVTQTPGPQVRNTGQRTPVQEVMYNYNHSHRNMIP